MLFHFCLFLTFAIILFAGIVLPLTVLVDVGMDLKLPTRYHPMPWSARCEAQELVASGADSCVRRNPPDHGGPDPRPLLLPLGLQDGEWKRVPSTKEFPEDVAWVQTVRPNPKHRPGDSPPWPSP